jgi:hypothetical protein
MLSIKLSTDIGILREICAKCYRIAGPEHYLYLACEGEERLAAGLFEVGPDRVSVIFYEGPKDDAWLFDAVLRAGLNYGAGQGIYIGHLPEEFRRSHSIHFKKLNYPAGYTLDISNFFRKYKRCNMNITE